ncbi:pantetheine-phosphate adenylyltransferase [Lactobacillus jensenii]|jgi:pantetheine-phosphate adenylyltransferase|uniref:Phosphopantetheine adenylyltransferase n=1 Tax=Lactobacillus jensenii TaxID=109790 RepID=A0A5N1IC76_LACJE|nr:pantetheine-phosphate adenylyltransferase [Lactobacillus jensenii]EEQ68139.1 pantetheine-phosphate adenylyltransferase [Lactobacillus jensenii 1153]ERJ42784.1 phosphopantetheine adenylyltransferase [Lactobacillus jensenii MD IIE-70(2)]APT14934.1 pantetheine-phosphate adenylyltransferase [Lactobacillus jensenii]EEQ24454.1 pantetheine-phosphate adenylyltransferase [Lactobacillus jensenii 269-3]EEX27641.1 pantetheine-phosphate adenylyltransferase [Lactobacillus jensenii SJ-7A-US]
MVKAIFPGSFDPVTNGHLETIKQASKAFDKVFVVIMTNTSKKYLFSARERAELVEDALADLKLANVSVLTRPATLTVDVAKELQTNIIVRGLRNSEDFLYEQQISAMNKKLNPAIETIYFMTSSENSFVASSMIKEIAKFNGDVSQFLPEKAALALKRVLGSNEK